MVQLYYMAAHRQSYLNWPFSCKAVVLVQHNTVQVLGLDCLQVRLDGSNVCCRFAEMQHRQACIEHAVDMLDFAGCSAGRCDEDNLHCDEGAAGGGGAILLTALVDDGDQEEGSYWVNTK